MREKPNLHIILQGKNLKNNAHFGKLNCYAELTIFEGITMSESSKPFFASRTEVIGNLLNPVWAGAFIFDIPEEPYLSLYIDVYHNDRKRKKDHLLGSTKITIDEKFKFEFPFNSVKKNFLNERGTIIATFRKQFHDISKELSISLRGFKLRNVANGILGNTAPAFVAKMRLMGKSDPFFEISRQFGGKSDGKSEWRTVVRSNYVKNNLSPAWEPLIINLFHLCDNDSDMKLKVTILGFDGNRMHISMGSFFTTVNNMFMAMNEKSAITLKECGEVTGVVFVDNFQIHDSVENTVKANADTLITQKIVRNRILLEKSNWPDQKIRPAPSTFSDYLEAGCKLRICFAIDFSSANKNYHHPSSSHYLHNDGKLNEYEMVILAMGSIVSKYTKFANIDILAFGLKQDSFICNDCKIGSFFGSADMKQVLETYQNFLRCDFFMSDHTVLTEVINRVSKQAKNDFENKVDCKQYTVLFIITHGVLEEIEATKSAIEIASKNPLSIIIVGIGGGEFSEIRSLMNVLNIFPAKKARDITSFMEFHSHLFNLDSFKDFPLPGVPHQVVDFFCEKNIMLDSKMLREMV